MDDEMNGSKNKAKANDSLWFGVVLIILGAIFLLQRTGTFSLHNWWALFILIPTFSAFASAIRMWQRDGMFHFGVWSTFYGGIFPLVVALMFLLELDWGVYWPLFVIIGGFGSLINGFPFARPKEVKVPDWLLRHRPWSFFLGLAGLLLGIVFLARNLDLFEITTLIPFDNWWGVFPLIAALGGVVTAISLGVRGHSFILVLVNLGGAALVAAVGLIAMYNLNWELLNYFFPALLILVGIGMLVGFGSRKGSGTGDAA
jgi:hypothetical protein